MTRALAFVLAGILAGTTLAGCEPDATQDGAITTPGAPGNTVGNDPAIENPSTPTPENPGTTEPTDPPVEEPMVDRCLTEFGVPNGGTKHYWRVNAYTDGDMYMSCQQADDGDQCAVSFEGAGASIETTIYGTSFPLTTFLEGYDVEIYEEADGTLVQHHWGGNADSTVKYTPEAD